jgi:hypothetical protein
MNLNTIYSNKIHYKYKRFLCLVLIFILIVFSPMPAFYFQKETNDNLESKVKAAYIYNFTKFVRWNQQDGNINPSPLTIAVFGADPIGNLLEEFSKNMPEGQSIIVKKNKKDLSSAVNCNLLFISQQEQQRLSSIFKQLEGSNVLTVSDIPGFVRRGGMIGFFVKDDKVKIEINLNAVNKAGLKISAKLLEVARIVSEED